MKYKVGDEFIVKIKEVMDSDNGTLYRSNFNTLVFDEYGLDKLQKLEDTDFLEGLKTGLTGLSCKSKEAYEKGLADAWELARKIADISTTKERADIFGYCCNGITVTDVLRDFTPQQALAKIEAYEKEQEEIKVGDVVEFEVGTIAVVTRREEEYIYVCFGDGTNMGFVKDEYVFKKTGRHIDITQILEQIRGE